MEHGKVTTVNYEDGAVYCNVRSLRGSRNEYDDVPVMKSHSGFIQIPKQRERVTMEKLKDGTRFISNVLSRESETPDKMQNGEIAIQLDEGTRIKFEERNDGNYDLHIGASGDVYINGTVQ